MTTRFTDGLMRVCNEPAHYFGSARDELFAIHGVGCKPIRRGLKPTADFTIEFARPVVCEVKQIEANDDDVECSGKQDDGGRFLENRLGTP